MKQFSDIEQWAAQDTDPWEKGNRWGEPCDGSSLLPWELLGCTSWRMSPNKACSLPELRRQRRDFGGAMAARILRAAQRAPEMCRGFHSRPQLNTEQCQSVRKLPEAGKEPPGRSRKKNSWSSHELGRVHVLNNQDEEILLILGELV